ncbi:MAG: response regulator [Chloroflexi bacterium]|nr:response regulator [Chloroflexota bacterium]
MPIAQALVIDDNSANILVLQQLLAIEDVACVSISSTRNLLYQLDSLRNIDVVFLDLEMPVLNGYEAVRVIKAHPHFADAMVIAYSVHVSELHNAIAMGFDGFLGKPLNAEEFPEQLAQILNGDRVNYIP